MITQATLPGAAPVRVLACGAYLKNRACLIDGERLLWSASHGDLVDATSREALDDSVEQLLREASGTLDAVAHDLHPDFHSTHIAQALAERLGVPAIAVQHHHAHIAVVQAEQAMAGPVIGIALDGIGLGDEGDAWGGELLWVDSGTDAHRWRRLDHLAPILLPGGDAAAREPWRMAAAALFGLGRGDEIEGRLGPVVGSHAAHLVHSMMARQINSPATTSAGRWFDAAAGALGLCVRQRSEAEAAIALEVEALRWMQAHPEFDFPWTSLEIGPLIDPLFEMAGQGEEAIARGAALFHMGLANGLAHSAIAAAREHGTSTIVLGGGCFLNQVLSDHLSSALRAAGLIVLRPQASGCGDAGLALGQAWVAACTVRAEHPVETFAEI